MSLNLVRVVVVRVSNLVGVRPEFYIHIINLTNYFNGSTEFSPSGYRFPLRITSLRAFASGRTSLLCSSSILFGRLVAGCIEQ